MYIKSTPVAEKLTFIWYAFTLGLVAVHNQFPYVRCEYRCTAVTQHAVPNSLKDDPFVKDTFCTNGSNWSGMIFMLRC